MHGRGVLREAAGLIANGWCCGAEARNGYGSAVAALHPSATAWSLRGALTVVSERDDAEVGALRDALWGISGVPTGSWTGGTTLTAALRSTRSRCSLSRR